MRYITTRDCVILPSFGGNSKMIFRSTPVGTTGGLGECELTVDSSHSMGKSTHANRDTGRAHHRPNYSSPTDHGREHSRAYRTHTHSHSPMKGIAVSAAYLKQTHKTGSPSTRKVTILRVSHAARLIWFIPRHPDRNRSWAISASETKSTCQ